MKRVRRQISYANAAATLALLFAMSGGVMAATGGLGGSSGRLRACVSERGGLTLLQSGKHCKRGQKAISWNQEGPQGAPGASGTPGSPGARGAPGTAGQNGVTGFTSTLPSGKTEIGTFGGSVDAAASPYYMAIGFAIPLAAEPEVNIVGEKEGPTEACPGTASKPQAESGQLCIYAGELFQGTLFTFDPSKENGDETYGLILGLKATGARAIAYGTWAVTG